MEKRKKKKTNKTNKQKNIPRYDPGIVCLTLELTYAFLWQEAKWKRCKRLISGDEKLNRAYTPRNDSDIFDIYKPDEDCAHVLQTRFLHPPVTMEEKQLPIAYAFTLYKGARLFERILQAIYMPNNLYCIHIDKKSPEVFRKAIQAMIRCLPNVFISENSTDVAWGHFTVVQAQLNCMEELLEASVKWKYYISLVGQDFPLYDNRQIVKALQGLNNSNSINSNPMPPSQLSSPTYSKTTSFFKLGQNHHHRTIFQFIKARHTLSP